MQILLVEDEKNLRELQGQFSRTAVALGGFDAMHLGHQAIIQKVTETAREEDLTSAVYFFVNQPREVLGGERIPRVNSLAKRLEILEEQGVEIAIAQRITPEFLQTEPEMFVRDYLKEVLDASLVAAGFNYRFGKGGRGDIRQLQRLGEPMGIRVCEVPCVEMDGMPVSSSRIRQLVLEGKMEAAEACLGRPFALSGEVVAGNRFGRKMGIPTANLEFPEKLLLPKEGVYLTETKVDGIWYPSMTNVGGKPSVKKNHPGIETHLLDFAGDLYGKEIDVRFRKQLRGIIKFETPERLQAQLEQDKEKAKEYFG